MWKQYKSGVWTPPEDVITFIPWKNSGAIGDKKPLHGKVAAYGEQPIWFSQLRWGENQRAIEGKNGHRGLSGHFYGGAYASFCDCIAGCFQILIFAIFHCVFSFEMNKIRALFGLFGGMSANFNQCFNHPLKRIHLFIPYDQAIWLIVFREHISIYKFLCFAVFVKYHTSR